MVRVQQSRTTTTISEGVNGATENGTQSSKLSVVVVVVVVARRRHVGSN